MSEHHDDLPSRGPALALALQRRHPDDDWLAALAEAVQRPRGDVERYLQEDGELPPFMREGARQVSGLLQAGPSSATDDAPGADA
jgi:hypothetical protein